MKCVRQNTVLCALLLLALLGALVGPAAAAAPRRALLVTKEVGLAVDPIGVVQSIELSSSVSFNLFCEFVRRGAVALLVLWVSLQPPPSRKP
jgi:hypothetical protein